MNKVERIKMVKAMEFIARQINDEEVFENWLISGVADGDIEYGDLEMPIKAEDQDYMDYYIDDKHFADLMHTFLEVMSDAYDSGGLYCDEILDKAEINN